MSYTEMSRHSMEPIVIIRPSRINALMNMAIRCRRHKRVSESLVLEFIRHSEFVLMARKMYCTLAGVQKRHSSNNILQDRRVDLPL